MHGNNELVVGYRLFTTEQSNTVLNVLNYVIMMERTD